MTDKLDEDFDRWFCPLCKYLITDVELQSARFNYTCPSCKKRSLSDYQVVEKEEN